MYTQRQIVAIATLIAVVMVTLPVAVMGDQYNTAISVAPTANESTLVSPTDGGLHPPGLIPPPLDLSHIRASESRLIPLLMQEHLPAVYDLRSQGKVTPVKAQGRTGSCWAFSAIASLESYLLPGETRDFSENHMKNLCSRSYPEGFDHVPADGGNDVIATAYLARWTGPVNEEDDPYDDASDESPMDLLPEIHVQNVLFLPDLTGPDEAVALKRAIMEYGAVYTSMYMNENYPYHNYETAGYYYDGTKKSNHAVTVVGWNDTYDKNQFASIPPQDGAWIIKNSWGTKFGDEGYFYVSYCDSMIGTRNIVFTTEDASNYDLIYQHDPLGWVGSIGTGSDAGWFAAVFTADADEDLRAVSFYAGQCDSPYELYVYLDPAGGPINASGPIEARSGVIDDAGYRTIPLENPVALSPGQTFSIAMNLTTPGYNRPIPVEYPKLGYSSKATAERGEGYVRIDGEWEDLTDKYKDYSPCLKAFTTVRESLSITSIAPSHGHRIVQAANLSGTGFQSGATVKLTRTEQPDIVATGVSVVSRSQITCTLNLAECVEGTWDVVVENPDGETTTLREGFIVTTPLALTTDKDIIVRGGSVTVVISGESDHTYLMYVQAVGDTSSHEYPTIAPGQSGVSCVDPGTILNVTVASCANVTTTSLGRRSVRFDTNASTGVGTYTIGVIDWADPSQSFSIPVGVEQGDEPGLTANFTANVTAGPVPLTVRFIDESTGGVTAWNWTFGDGSTSDQQSPIHTYAAPGNYSVSLTASDGHAENTMTKEHYILVQPPSLDAQFTFNVNYNRGTLNDTITSGTSSCRLTYLMGVHNLPGNRENILGNLTFILDAPGITSTEPPAEIDGTQAIWTFPAPAAISPGTTRSTAATTSIAEPRTSGVTLERSCNRTVFTEAGVQQVTLSMTFDTTDLDHLWGRITCTETDDALPAIIPDTFSTDLPLHSLNKGRTGIQFTVNRSAIEAGRQYTLSCAVEVNPSRSVAYAPNCVVWEVLNSTTVAASAGTAVSLPADLLPESVTNVTFSSATFCEWTCTQNSHIITSLYQRAVPVSAPVANFSANVTSGVAPLAVRFIDESTGDPTSHLWDFGDGNTSTVRHPIHTYTSAENYTVALSIDGGLSNATKQKYIKVTPILFGDADGNEMVNQADTLHVLKWVVGLLEEQPDLGSKEFQKTDVNHNGFIDVGDALFIAQYNVGLRDVWLEVLE